MKPVARLVLAFPRQDVSRDTMSLYVDDLGDIPTSVLDEAVTILIRTSEWFPSIRAIREACAELVLGLPTENDALAQIDARIRWARLDESTRGPSPDIHPLVLQALNQIGGWAAFRSSDEAAITRAQFSRIYREIRAGAIRDTQLAAMPAQIAPQATSHSAGVS